MTEKYIIKAYEEGKFYGYFAPHPDDKENRCYSYYVDDIKDARLFDSYEKAAIVIERFQDSSGLDYMIIEVGQSNPEYLSFAQTIATVIRAWVDIHYGTSEAENPSWDIDGLSTFLADAFQNHLHGVPVHEINEQN